jgi:hypothetical protein
VATHAAQFQQRANLGIEMCRRGIIRARGENQEEGNAGNGFHAVRITCGAAGMKKECRRCRLSPDPSDPRDPRSPGRTFIMLRFALIGFRAFRGSSWLPGFQIQPGQTLGSFELGRCNWNASTQAGRLDPREWMMVFDGFFSESSGSVRDEMQQVMVLRKLASGRLAIPTGCIVFVVPCHITIVPTPCPLPTMDKDYQKVGKEARPQPRLERDGSSVEGYR